MDVIFNDFSISQQFLNIDEFIESLYTGTLPALNLLAEKSNLLLLKSQDIFNKNICVGVNFSNFIYNESFGYPEILKFKSLLLQLIDEPFWETYARTDVDSEYYCESIGNFNGRYPNCFSEAIERELATLSLMHDDYKKSFLKAKKNNLDVPIINIFDKHTVCDFLFFKNVIGFSEYLMRRKYPVEIKFLSDSKNEYYADKCYNDGLISKEDILGIDKTFERHIDQLHSHIESKLVKKITHKQITYYEFRDKLSDSREFRIFYYRMGDKIIYLNSLIKKTQATPDEVKDFTVRLIKSFI